METETGMRVVNCYDTEAQLRDGYDAADVRDALRQAGIEYQAPQIVRVHDHVHVSG
jgi:hypothetical protein